jgi:hypothetical protein
MQKELKLFSFPRDAAWYVFFIHDVMASLYVA